MSILEIPTELVEFFAQYMCDPDLLAFRSTCRFADSNTLRVVGRRFFSTVRTTLMGSGCLRLVGISQSVRLAKYVKTLGIQDDEEKIGKLFSRHSDPNLDSSEEWETRVRRMQAKKRLTSRIWPRQDANTLGVSKTAVRIMRTILHNSYLCLDALWIQDYRDTDVGTDNEPAIALAQEIVSGSRLAITSLQVKGTHTSPTWVKLRFDKERKGDDAGFSALRNADVQMGSGPASNHLLGQLLYRSPLLEDLRLTSLEARGICQSVPLDALTKQGIPFMKLKRVRLESLTCPAGFFQEILYNSRRTLQAISIDFVFLSSSTGFTWKDLLICIGKGFPALVYFDLRGLEQGDYTVMNFSDVNQRMQEATGKGELEVYGPYDEGVKFRGPGAFHALQAVASYARILD